MARNLGSSSVHEKSKTSEIVDFENSGKWGFWYGGILWRNCGIGNFGIVVDL